MSNLKKIYILELILFSGGVVFNGTFPRTCLIIWLVTAILLLIRHGVDRRNLKICVCFSLWILSVQYIFIKSSFDNTYLSYLLYLSGGLGLSVFSFNDFRNCLLKWMSIIGFLSIIVQLGFDLFAFPASIHFDDSGSPFVISMFFFNVAWASDSNSLLHRLSSIFWEPGQYQILITFTLCLFIKELTDFKNFMLWIKKFGVLILALLFTQSTMGYLSLILMMIVSYLFCSPPSNNSMIRKMVVKICSWIILVFSVGYLWQSSVVQDKLSQRDSGVDNSYNIRLADNIACFYAALESPIYGQGVSSKQLRKRLVSLGSQTSSNGWLLSAASLGFVFVIAIIFIMYRRIDEMGIIKRPLALLIILVLSQCNESVMYFPYIYIYIYHFDDNYRLKCL